MTSLAIGGAAVLRERILDAAERGTRLRIVGRGTWLDAGRPVPATEWLSTRELSGIVDYVPGDLTLTARAGTTLGEIREATSAHGQWLALDPFGSDEGTIGATVATASSGPLRTSFGGPRDLVLGVEFVTGLGAIARGGGRVVKNVAGFDLVRVMTGAWGTLAVLTEVTVRLHALPQADESVAIAVDPEDGPGHVRRLLRRLPFRPYACEVLNASLAHGLVGSAETVALLRLGGNADAVRAQRAALTELGAVRELDGAVWPRLRAVEPEDAIVFRLSSLPSEIDATWSEALAVVSPSPDALVHATPTMGVVRCVVPAGDTVARRMEQAVDNVRGTLIGERLPARMWSRLESPARDPLSRRVKTAFDPHGRLNAGILGEGE